MPVKLITVNKDGHPLTPTPKEQVVEMVQEFQKTFHTLSTKNLRERYPDRTFEDGSPFCDAKSAWVSKAEIEQLLSDNVDADGVRIYYGCHKNPTSKEAGMEYQSMHNIILVATKSSWEHPGYKSADMLKEANNEKEANSIIVGGISGGYEGEAGDMVPLCPPRCPDKPIS